MITFDELSKAVYEDLDGRILTVSADSDAYRVIFECDDWCDDSHRRRRFTLAFDDVPEACVTPSMCGEFHIMDDHPLLWEHNDDNVAMFFSSAPVDPFRLIGRLYEAHANLLDGWRQLSDYWRTDSKLLRVGYGLLAEGPRRVIDEYASIIADTMQFSIVQVRSPHGGYRVVLFDECYVVCRSVSVIEHEMTT